MLKKILIGLPLLLVAQASNACSGYNAIAATLAADLIVSGSLTKDDQSLEHHLNANRVIKGEKAKRLQIVWPIQFGDECDAFGPLHRDKGVYFLQKSSDGKYEVIWTEKRWSKRWRKWFK